MMTRKREMAEWILDFFRRAKVDEGQIIMFRNVQNKLLELNPKERYMFTPVAKELIKNGYFTYEEGNPQSLRLTKKGRDYIYDSNAVLDCCYDTWTPDRIQAQYLANWYNSFVGFINTSLSEINVLLDTPGLSDQDRYYLRQYKDILTSRDIEDIENSLRDKLVMSSTIEKIDKLHHDLNDIAWDHLLDSPIIRGSLKKLSHLRLQLYKDNAIQTINSLGIPVFQG